MTTNNPNDESTPASGEAPEAAQQAGATDEAAPGAQLDPSAVATTGAEPAAETSDAADTAGAGQPATGAVGAGTDTTATDSTAATVTEQPTPQAGPIYTAPAPQQDDNDRSPGGIVAGAAAIVSTVLGAMALLGNPVSNMLREHRQVSGQVESIGGGGGGGNEIATAYTTPWHTAALSNGIIAVVAVLIGGVTLAAWLHARDTKWAKAVALGGMILGVIGILVSAGMYFDWFATPPEMPKQPQMPGMG